VVLVVVGLTPLVLEGLEIRHLEAHRKEIMVETVLLLLALPVILVVVVAAQGEVTGNTDAAGEGGEWRFASTILLRESAQLLMLVVAVVVNIPMVG
jgi:hypothetical protein